MKIVADFAGREAERPPPRDDEKTYSGSQAHESYICGSSCVGTSVETCTDIEANVSMNSDGCAVYGGGTEYHGADNLSGSGPGETTPGRSYYDQKQQIQGVNGEMYETENSQSMHFVQKRIPENIPYQNGFHNLETKKRSSPEAIGPPQQATSLCRSTNYVYFADDDGPISSESSNGMNQIMLSDLW